MTWRGSLTGCTLAIVLTACTFYTTSSGDDDATDAASSGAPATSTSSGGSDAASGSSGTSASGSSGTSASGSSGASSSSSSTSSSASSTSGGPLTSFEQTLLDGFNQVRATADPEPQPALSVLYWDYEAAAACKAYADQCGGDAQSGMVWGGGSSPFEAEEVLAFMTQDRQYYDYDSNNCSGGSTDCNIYKMIVRRTVNRVGCARTTCGSEDRWACKFTVVGNLADQPY